MKQIRFIILGLIFFSMKLYSSCPPPMIQAVCQIIKTDGSVVQGYIKLGSYGCNGLWMNGFLSYSDTIYLKADYFTMDIKSIEFKERLIIKKYGGNGNSCLRKKYIKYMSWKQNPSIYQPYIYRLENVDNNLVYKVQSQLVKEYILSDSIKLYKELNLYTFIPGDNEKAKFLNIAINDIAKITLLEKDEISNLTELINKGIEAEKIANGPDSSGDFQLPLWYHDIILSDRMLKQVNEDIENYTLRN